MKMEDYHNKHIGKIACILGAGPSLRHFDIEMFDDRFVMFCVNSSIAKLPETDYYVSDDNGIMFWNYYREYIVPSKCMKFLYGKKLERFAKHIPEDKKVYYDHMSWCSKSKSNINLTDNPNAPLIGARTSLATSLHIAYIMGIRKFILFGCDCQKEEDKRYFWEFPGEAHVYPIIPEITEAKYLQEAQSHFDDFKTYWKAFEECNRDKVEIINCSDGVLDTFPRMSVEEAIDKLG